MDGQTAFFPSSDFAVDPCTTGNDFMTEEVEDLSYCSMAYNDSINSSGFLELLSDFLLHWEPSNCDSFIRSIRELSTSMSDGHQVPGLKDIWGKDNSLLNAWLSDLTEVCLYLYLQNKKILFKWKRHLTLFVCGYFRWGTTLKQRFKELSRRVQNTRNLALQNQSLHYGNLRFSALIMCI